MRILYILDRFPVVSETFITGEIRTLVELGHHVTIGYFRWGGDPVHEIDQWIVANLQAFQIPRVTSRWPVIRALLLDGVRHRSARALSCVFSKEPRWVYSSMTPLAASLRGKGIQHVRLHFADRHAVLGAAVADLLGVDYSITLHGYDIRDLPIGREGVIALVENAKAAFTVSAESQRRLEGLGVREGKLKILPAGIDARLFSHMAPRYKGGRLEIVCVARLHPIKAQETIIEALSLLKKRFDYRLTLVGDGRQRGFLEARAREEGIREKVHFVGALDSQQVRERLLKSHMHVLPSRHEGLGIASVEAMAVGLFVVGTRVGGIPEVIRDGETGILFDVGSAEDLASIISQFQEAPLEYERLRVNARAFATSNFDQRELCNRLLRAIRE